MSKSEYELVCQACSGNVEAFGHLYVLYYKSMVAIAVSYLRCSALAEDIAQEAFITGAQNIASLNRPDKFAVWLAGICRNKSRNLLRKRKEKILSDGFPALKIDAESKTDSEIQDFVRQAVWQLPPKKREIIILRYYDGLSYEQIAKINGLTVQAVNGRLLRAKKTIRDYLKKKGVYEQ